MRFVVLFILLVTNLSVWAQTYTGRVKDNKGEFLAGASVVVLAEGKSTVAYCLTNDKGEYKLNISEGKNQQV